MEGFMRKVASRKFLLSLAAFLAAFCGGVAGVLPPEWCAVGMAVSAGIYAACEAYVDGKAAEGSGVQTVYTENVTKAVTATSADKATVVAAFNAGKEE